MDNVADPEDIRRKRLEKLSSSTQFQSMQQSSNHSSAQQSSLQQPARKIEPKAELVIPADKPRQLSTTRKENQIMSSQVSPASTPTITPNITPSQYFTSMSEDEYDHIICTSVLDVTLEIGTSHLYLEQIVNEFNSESIELKLKNEYWERILYNRITLDINSDLNNLTLLDYLVNCWSSLLSHTNKLRAMDSSETNASSIIDKRLEKLTQFMDLIMNYIGLNLNEDTVDMFPQNHSFGSRYFGHNMTKINNQSDLYSQDFINALIEKFKGVELENIVGTAIDVISREVKTKSISTDYMGCIRALNYLVSSLQTWIPADLNARSIESTSILGPFLSSLSIFPDSDLTICSKYFAANGIVNDSIFDSENINGSRNQMDIKTSTSALRDSSLLVHQQLHQIILAIIKSSGNGKLAVLKFIYKVIELNRKRGQMQVNRQLTSTDGFIHNLLEICKKLCEPILDTNFSKIGLINNSFFLISDKINIIDETRLNVEVDVASQILIEYPRNDKPLNFVTEIFFCTLSLHHYGLLSTMLYYKNFVQELEEMKKHGRRHVAMRHSGQWESMDALNRAANEQGLTRLQNEIDKLIGVKLAIEATLLDKAMLESSVRFYNLVMIWLIKCATGESSHLDWSRISQGDSARDLFPFKAVSREFTTLPQWIIEDICDFYLFIMRNAAPLFENSPRNEFITFAMVMLSNSASIKNPYLKSKLIEIMYSFTLPLYRTQTGQTMGRLDSPFFVHPYAKDYLVSSILSFYIEVEQTGMSSQFYDKFNIRYNISQILKSVWLNPDHRLKIVQLSKDHDFFVKFVALLMNDTTYLLDESMSKLKEIGTIQIELSNPETGTQQHRQERESTMQGLERHLVSYMLLANETVNMFSYLTAIPEIVDPFMATEIICRLAAMLDYNLVALTGPRCTELKVKNPEKYHFDPRVLLGKLIDIFIHLSHRHEFVAAVAQDGRSFDKSVFMRACGILEKHAIKSYDEIQTFLGFIERVDIALKNDVAEEEELGDIPDEFLDPLLFTIMKEPVRLPSGITIDLSTIRSHLLSDSHDPFNRQPLTLADCIPDLELKAKFDSWKRDRKAMQ